MKQIRIVLTEICTVPGFHVLCATDSPNGIQSEITETGDTGPTMVQIRQKDLRKRSAFQRGVLGLLRFCVVTGTVPLLFVGRHYYTQRNAGVTLNAHGKKTKKIHSRSDMKKPIGESSPVKIFKDSDAVEAKAEDIIFHDPAMFDLLDNTDWSEERPMGSQVVELMHCDADTALLQHRSNFTFWAGHLVMSSVNKILALPQRTFTETDVSKMKQEFILELLEMYLTSRGYCDFSTYEPTVPLYVAGSVTLTKTTTYSGSRFVFSIVAFHDFSMLERLVEALLMPQHVLLIHLDLHVDEDYVKEVQALEQAYANVHVLHFGAIVYPTDSVSMINYRIMRWLISMGISFDYFLTLDGASFPLYSPEGLLKRIDDEARPVYLGETLRKGQPVRESQVAHLRQKRLVYTTGSQVPLAKRLPRNLFHDESIPEYIRELMTTKTNSGNQAIFSKSIVRQLVESVEVRELFALSKYGCCCCLEELNWATALRLIGVKDKEIHASGSTLQVWGGESTCGSSMKNAVLSENEARRCFQLEEAHLLKQKPKFVNDGLYVWSNSTWELLQFARDRGILLARKFNSTTSGSLLDRIELEWHGD